MMSMRKRITQGASVLACVLLGASQLVVAGQRTPSNPKYGVTVLTSKPEGLANAKTYVWMVGQPAYDKTVDKQIVAAIDRELAAKGFTKLPSGKSDVLVTYASANRTDTDLKAKPEANGTRPQYAVGTIVVDLQNPPDHVSFFKVRMDTPIDKTDPAKLEATINEFVAAMFAKYPTPTTKR